MSEPGSWSSGKYWTGPIACILGAHVCVQMMSVWDGQTILLDESTQADLGGRFGRRSVNGGAAEAFPYEAYFRWA